MTVKIIVLQAQNQDLHRKNYRCADWVKKVSDHLSDARLPQLRVCLVDQEIGTAQPKRLMKFF